MQKKSRRLRLVGREEGGRLARPRRAATEAPLRQLLAALLADPVQQTGRLQADFRDAAAPVRTVIPAQDIYLA